MGKKYVVMIAVILSVFVGIGCNSGSDVGSSVWSGLPTSGTSGVETGAITGKITDSSSTPVDKALIEILDSTSTVVQVAFTDDKGDYKLSTVPVGSYQLRVSKDKFVYLYKYITIIPENIVQFSAKLDPDSGVLTGRVINALTTQSLANAQIQIYSENNPTNPVTGSATVFTGTDGTFRVNLSSGTYSLIASKNDFASARLTGLLIQTNQQNTLPQDIALSPTAGLLVGTVLGVDDQPVNGALVEVRSTIDPSIYQSMLSGGTTTPLTGGIASGILLDVGSSTAQLAPGAFQFTLSTGTYRIQATMNGFLAASTTTTLNVLGNTPVTLKLTSTPMIVGLVTGFATGTFAVLQDVLVQATNIVDKKVFSSQTTTTGSYTIPVSVGNFSVSFTKAGYLTETRTASVGGSGVIVNAEMYPNPVITGTVNALVAGTLTPQGGAQVTVLATQSGVLTTVVEGTTETSGVYSLAVNSTGIYRIVFSKSGFSTVSQDVTIASRGRTLSVTFGDLPSLPLVTGIVLKPDPVNGGLVAASAVTVSVVNQTTSIRSEATTGLDGSFKLNVESGVYDITFFLSGYVVKTITQTVPTTGKILDNQVLYLPPALSGTISSLNQTTTPATLAGAAGALVRLIQGGVEIGSVFSDANGKYQFSVSTGTYDLEITKEGFTAVSVKNIVVPVSGKLQNVTLGDLPLVTGVVLQPDTVNVGAFIALSGVAVSAVNQTTSVRSQATTGSDGSFKFNLESGTYAITFFLVGYVGETITQIVPATGVALGSKTMYPPPTLSGMVYFRNGINIPSTLDPAIGALVRLVKGGVEVDSALSDSSGKYKFTVSTGTYDLEITKDGFLDSSVKNIAVPISGKLQNVTLGDLPLVTGVVVDNALNPLANVAVSAVNKATSVRTQATTGADGSFKFNLESGTYDIAFFLSAYARKTITRTIPTTGLPLENQILYLPTTLSGIIYSLDEITAVPTPVGGALVRLLDGNSKAELGFVLSDPSTGYKFSDLVSTGSYDLEISKDGFVATWVRGLTVPVTGKSQNATLGNIPPLPSVVGVVLDNAHAALSDVVVSAVNLTTLIRKQATSTATGSFTLNLAPGTYDITFSLSTYAAKTITQIVPAAGKVMGDVILYRLTSLSGVVYFRDETTNPVSFKVVDGALVQLMQGGAVISSARSGATGEYLFSDLSTGTYDLEITKEEYVATTTSVIIPVTGKIQDVTLLLYPVISGIIYDNSTDTTKLLADVNIRAESIADPSKVFQTKTDTGGKYSLTVNPNTTYTISYKKDLYQDQVIPKVTTPPTVFTVNTSNVIQNLVMYKQVLKGFIYKTDGTALAGCLVVASGTTAYPSAQLSVRSGTSGDYEINIPSSQFNVSFINEGYETTTRTMTANGNMDLDITISQYSSISGYVLASPAMTIVSGAEIRIYKKVVGDYILVKSVLSDNADGSYSLALTDGTYWFTVIKSGYKILDKRATEAGMIVAGNAQTRDFVMDTAP
ncbi:MAG: carboxypeptidase-like regulatory domain-containing protein [Candidatus Ozemobacteraceae bacterium]